MLSEQANIWFAEDNILSAQVISCSHKMISNSDNFLLNYIHDPKIVADLNISLRKHAYSNTLKILLPKKENF